MRSDRAGQLGDSSYAKRTRPTRLPALSDIVGLAAGEKFSMAVDRSGRVWTWGANEFGELGLSEVPKRPGPALVPSLTACRMPKVEFAPLKVPAGQLTLMAGVPGSGERPAASGWVKSEG